MQRSRPRRCSARSRSWRHERHTRELVRVPAMPNAHSHAFQLDLRGAGERPAPAAHAADDFWSWRREMFRLAGALDPASMRAVAERAYAEMAAAGYGAVGEFHYVHHRPDGTPYDEGDPMAHAVAQAAVDQGLAIVLLPAAYHRDGWDGADRAPAAGQRRFCDPDVDTFLTRVDALRRWAAGRAGRQRRRRRPQRARRPRAVAAGDRRVRRRARPRPPRARQRAAPRAGRVRRRARLHPDRAAAPDRIPRRAHERHPRGPRHRRRRRAARHERHDRRLVPDDRGQPRRRPPARDALSATRACVWRSAATRRCGSTRSRRSASWRPAPGASARRGTRCSRRAATCGASCAATAAPASGCPEAGDGAGTIAIDLGHPSLSGIAREDLPYALATCASAAVLAAPRAG